jgi:hypothetical protein
MATRVDPKQYGDTPIFQGLLEERRGRWPGIPMEELPALPVPHDGAPYTLPVMSRVQAVRPYTLLTDYDPENMPERDWDDVDCDPEATAEMPFPRAVGE